MSDCPTCGATGDERCTYPKLDGTRGEVDPWLVHVARPVHELRYPAVTLPACAACGLEACAPVHMTTSGHDFVSALAERPGRIEP